MPGSETSTSLPATKETLEQDCDGEALHQSIRLPLHDDSEHPMRPRHRTVTLSSTHSTLSTFALWMSDGTPDAYSPCRLVLAHILDIVLLSCVGKMSTSDSSLKNSNMFFDISCLIDVFRAKSCRFDMFGERFGNPRNRLGTHRLCVHDFTYKIRNHSSSIELIGAFLTERKRHLFTLPQRASARNRLRLETPIE